MSAPALIPEALFDQAIAIADDQERASFLDRACGSDSDLRRQAERLVQDHFQAGSFLDRPGVVLDLTTDAAASQAIGSQIGPYKLLEQIGEGGMGVVYVAEQTEPVRRRVALKIIKPGMDTQQVIARFEAERQALAMMDHPNIARILDAGTVESSRQTPSAVAPDDGTRSVPTTTGRPFFVMELVRGMPITEYCDKAKLEPRKRLELFIDVCHAVQHAHQKGIIHRDLKPSNVMVTLHDGTPVVKVIDFGVAKAIGQSLTDRTIYTAHAQLIGTPLYMSPEQAELSGLDVDTRSDVYSLGVLLYELLTGHTPFDKETLSKAGFDEMRRIIREDEPPRPSHRVSTLNAQVVSTVSQQRSLDERKLGQVLRGELDWIVMNSLEKDRERRYDSAGSMARDVQRYLDGELVQACPPSTLYRFRKFYRKHQTTLLTTVLIIAGLVLVTQISLWQAIRATAAEAKAKNKGEIAVVLAQAESEQRKQAEANFGAALDAVHRMLELVNDAALNDLPRVGPMRRKLLSDVVAFYEQIPNPSQLSPALRYRIVQTWDRIRVLYFQLNELERARWARQKAIELLQQLDTEYPKEEYHALLARFLQDADYMLPATDESVPESIKRAAEIYGELAQSSQYRDRWTIKQADCLCALANRLRRSGKPEEAIRHLGRANELLDPNSAATAWSRAQIHYQQGWLNPERTAADQLLRLTLTEARQYLATDNPNVASVRDQYAGWCRVIGGRFTRRHPDEAEQLLDESIALNREKDKASERRDSAMYLVWALTAQSRHLRSRVVTTSGTDDPKQRLAWHSKAEELFRESISRQRQMVSRFELVDDRFELVKMLAEEAQYLRDPATPSATPQEESPRAKADELLSEAIQLCHELTDEFPDNPDYKSRLTELQKLHAQHFGQKGTRPEPK